MRIRNVSPMGALFVPALGVEVEPGAEIDLPDSLAEGFVGQSGTWLCLDVPASITESPEG